jgi:hypothetical protein
MPALTLAQITDLLSFYTPSDGSFLPRVNQTLARLNNMGTYRDLTVQYSLPVSDGRVTLPDDADAILHTLVDGRPSTVRSLWHDFKTVGFGSSDVSWGLVDDGFSPLCRLLPAAANTLHVVASPESPTRLPFDKTSGGSLEISAVGVAGVLRRSTEDIYFDGQQIVFGEDVTDVIRISFDSLQDRYAIRTDPTDANTTIATVGPGSGVSRYRRFRVPGSKDGATTVHVLCKRAFRMLVMPDDITHIGNINAIKNGFLATVAEDANDVERADFFWNKCFQLMEEEASSTRGAAQPRLTIDPYGAEGKFGIVGMM